MAIRSRYLPWLGVLSLLVGCTGGGVSSAGKLYLLNEKPSPVRGVIELKTALTEESASGGESVLVARVGGGQNPTWDVDKAAFLVRDLSLRTESHDHGGNADNCKFCQQERAEELEAMALVQIVDEAGQVVATDSRQLLGLKEHHIILARGTGEVDEVGNFVFSATGVYIEP